MMDLEAEITDNPKVLILISGKRKSGKDFISEKLLKTIGIERCQIIRISEPIKSYYAKENNLNLTELMSDNAYKEYYRLEMIKWSDEVRKKEPGYFCKAACAKAPKKSVWIISDVRRQTDIIWFNDTYGAKIKTVRIIVEDDIRIGRGYIFTPGVDDVTSECDLDNWTAWNLIVKNNNNEELEFAIQDILGLINL